MKQKIGLIILGIYDLILSLGAIFSGILMITSQMVFNKYPKEWLSKVPFESWFIPGIIAIAILGIGNFIAATFCFRKVKNHAWLASAIISSIFFASVILQVIILKEWYLATIELFILSMIQLSLSLFCLISDKKFNKGESI